MSYDAEWAKPALKALDKLDANTRAQLLQAVDALIGNKPLNIKKLKTRKDEWRIAVNEWRIILEKIKEKQVYRVLEITNRKDAYRR